jgi:LmbE family N-acetylglucosaminyl deacetylase
MSMKALVPTGRMMLVSPHLDDAVFSCGDLLDHCPDALVVTVFAGTPDTDASTDWDRRCGFGNPTDAMRARRTEDRAALLQLRARPRWLHFLDSQYLATPTAAAIAAAMQALIEETRPDVLIVPMGLFHSDHVLVSDALLPLAATHHAPAWVVYEDALYRCIAGQLQARLAALASQGIWLSPLTGAPQPGGRKAAAVRCYASQLRALSDGARRDLDDPERFWTLDRIEVASRSAVTSTSTVGGHRT